MPDQYEDDDALDAALGKDSGSFWETARTIVYAVLIAVVVRTFAYEPFNIPSGSMMPTLLVGDYLFVSKASYGYSRYSLPLGAPLIDGRVMFEEPERGDVAVFRLPTDTSVDYIKRIIGLPGDRIQVKGGLLYVNDKAVNRKRVDDFVTTDENGSVLRFPRYLETLPGGRSHYILETDGDNAMADNTGVYVVPEGHYFGMGDNRDRSRDSRFINHVGFIPAKNLVGRASFMFFSINGTVWKFWQWPWSLRIERFFAEID